MSSSRRPLPSSRRWRRGAVALAALAAVGLSACSADDTATPDAASAEAAGIRVATPEEASEILASQQVVLLDVRTPAEFAEGRLAGAQNIDQMAPDFADRLAELPRDESYVIYCRSGNRSAQARAVMEDLGFTDVVDIEGGILAWSQAGLPIEG